MPDKHNNPHQSNNNGASTIAAGASVAGEVAIQFGTYVYEKLTGDAYSEDDIKRLGELKRLYQEAFGIAAPISWDLDDKNKPTHRVKNQKWALHVTQLLQSKRLVGHYHYQSLLIAEYASTYLTDRGSRWVGKGKSGDLVEQFIGDWINFSLNNLPTLGFEEDSIRKIEQRIQYIEQVQKHESIFQFGTVERAKNKFDTVESIKQQLQSCLHVAAQESLRQCAREKFDACRSDISALLLACVQSMYYARATNVCHEPLELLRFIEPDEKFLTASAKKLYPKIKATHTGAMLYEAVSLAGLESFGTLGQEESGLLWPKYFTKDCQTKEIDWTKSNSDLPPWVAADSVNIRLKEFQLLGESVLRVANLKRLIEEAYDLTGKIGDLWAYGDKQGKLSLKALLFLLEKEVDLLKNRYESFYNYHNLQRHAYNLEHRINPKDELNPNFNKVDDQKINIDRLYASIKASSKSIQEQMEKIPENSPKRINAKKQEFYHSVSKYLKQFYPNSYPQYRLLEQANQEPKVNNIVINEDHIIDTDQPNDMTENDMPKEIILKWPLVTHQQCASYDYLDKKQFKNFFEKNPRKEQVDKQPKNWRLGNKYGDWMKLYFIHNKQDYADFQNKAQTLQNQAKDPTTLEDVNSAATALQNQIKILRKKIQEERPAWRFKLGIWPVITKGWPFNRDANKFADLLLTDLNTTSNKIEIAIKMANKIIEKRQPKEEKLLVNNRVLQSDLSLTALDKRILTTVKNPDEMLIRAAELSKINQTTHETTAVIIEKESKDENGLEKGRRLTNQWFETFKTQFNNWEDENVKFKVFVKKGDAQKALKDILDYRDNLPTLLVDEFIRSWDSFSVLINIEMENSDNTADDESIEQMSLLVKLINIFKTEPKSVERKRSEDNFNIECQQILSKREISNAINSYSTHGFLGRTFHSPDHVQQNPINSPNYQY